MMKSRLQKGIAVLLVLLLVFSLCACDAGNEEGDPTASAKASATATQKATATQTGTKMPVSTSAGTEATPTPEATTTPEVTTTQEPNDDPYSTDYSAVPGKAVIDGEVDDAWSKAEVTTLDYIKIINVEESDVTVKARMMWDSDGFYFLFEIEDAEISQENGVGAYQNDGIYLYISEQLQEGTTDFAQFTEGTYQFALISDALELIPRYGDADDLTYESAYKMTDNGMIIEFSYKPEYAELKAGTQMFMDLQYNECAGGSRLCAYGWYNDTDTNAQTDLWGVVKLVAE